MNKILVIDDDKDFADSLERLLTSLDYEVKTTLSAQSAKSIMCVEAFDLVLSDIRMPELNGIELLHWIKKNTPLKVVLMTGFSNMLETQEAYELGASGFLLKPFHPDDLVKTISSILPANTSNKNKSTSSDENFSDTDFCKVSIEEFIQGRGIRHPIYIRLRSQKYLKIAHEGQDIDQEQVEIYKSKGLKYLFLKKEDFGKLVEFNFTLAKGLKKVSDISKKKKQNFLRYSTEVLMEKVFIDGIDEEFFQTSSEFVLNCVDLLCEDQQSLSLLDSLNSHSDWLYAHSLGVSLYSSMIAQKYGWHTSRTKYRCAIGGLFHDIGKKELSRDLLEKPRHLMSPQERSQYESHPTRGREILLSITNIPDEIIQIASEHHEKFNGEGFPNKKRGHKILPIARLVAVANDFCKNTISSPGCKMLTIRESLDKQNEEIDEADQGFLDALKKCINLPEK